VLGAEVGVVEVLGLFEHVFAKQSFEQPGRCYRTDQVKVSGADFLGQANRVAGTVHVGPLLVFGACLEVVDGREVEKVLDGAFELLDVGFGHAKLRLRQVADDRDDARRVGAPVLVQFLESR